MISMSLILIVFALIAVVGGMAAVFLLNRSWGSSLDRGAGAPPPVPPQQPRLSDAARAQVRALVAADKKIEAIKLVRAQTGLGLKESKEYVEYLVGLGGVRDLPGLNPPPGLGGQSHPDSPAFDPLTVDLRDAPTLQDYPGLISQIHPDSPALDPLTVPADSAAVAAEARRWLERGNKIEAIKKVRELTGMGLKEAKDYVESL